MKINTQINIEPPFPFDLHSFFNVGNHGKVVRSSRSGFYSIAVALLFTCLLVSCCKNCTLMVTVWYVVVGVL